MSNKIKFKYKMAARGFQFIYPVLKRAFFSSPKLEFATTVIDKPKYITIPTRYGNIKGFLFSPTKKMGRVAPLHVITHGGAFIIQYPLEEGNVARYLASELGIYVLILDYQAAPQVQHPVAEEQCYDAFVWATQNGQNYGWDNNNISVGGPI